MLKSDLSQTPESAAPPPPAPEDGRFLLPGKARHVVRDAAEAGLAGSALLLVTPTEMHLPLLGLVWLLAVLWGAGRTMWPAPVGPARFGDASSALQIAAALAFGGLRCMTVSMAYLGAVSILVVAEFGPALLLGWITLLPVVFVGGASAALCFAMAGCALIVAGIGSLMRP